jgi:hypothetical protein
MMEDDSENSGNEDHGMTIMLATAEILRIDLKLIGYTASCMGRAKKKFTIDWFSDHFGCSPQVCCATKWQDLQKTAVEAARVEPKDLSINCFLMALHHLKQYPTRI